MEWKWRPEISHFISMADVESVNKHIRKLYRQYGPSQGPLEISKLWQPELGKGASEDNMYLRYLRASFILFPQFQRAWIWLYGPEEHTKLMEFVQERELTTFRRGFFEEKAKFQNKYTRSGPKV